MFAYAGLTYHKTLASVMHISDLGKMLSGNDPEMQRKAAELLSQHADAAVEVAVDLVRHVGDKDRVVAEHCVSTLEELGPPAASQLEYLGKLAANENLDVAYWAITLIGRSGVAGAEQSALLGDVVASDARPAVRERAAWALGRIGPAAAAAISQLEACVEAEPESVARAVSKALESIQGE